MFHPGALCLRPLIRFHITLQVSPDKSDDRLIHDSSGGRRHGHTWLVFATDCIFLHPISSGSVHVKRGNVLKEALRVMLRERPPTLRLSLHTRYKIHVLPVTRHCSIPVSIPYTVVPHSSTRDKVEKKKGADEADEAVEVHEVHDADEVDEVDEA